MPLLYYDLLFISFSEEKLLKLWGKSDKRNDEAIDESNDAVKCPVSSVLTIIISYVFFFITECLLLRGCWCLVYSLYYDWIHGDAQTTALQKMIFYRTPYQILILPGQAHFLIISPISFFGQTCANDCKVDSSTSNRTVGGTSYPTPIFFFK